MPSRKNSDELDFEIHVDPSCLSEPMDNTEQKAQMAPGVEVEKEELESQIPQMDDEDATSEAESEDQSEAEDNEPAVEATEDNAEEVSESEAESESETEGPEEEVDDDQLGPESHQATVEDEDSTLTEQPEEAFGHATDDTVASDSRRQSAASYSSYGSDRRGSSRTEAIHEAARGVVDQNRPRESLQSTTSTENGDYRSRSGVPRTRQSDAYTYGSRLSMDGHEDYRATVDEAGDNSSSHHENDDDVFSDDHSPRSSMGSLSESEHRKPSDMMSSITTRSKMSRISRYDRNEDFVPTIRGTPRPAFRSPSSVKALQMSSPPPSTLGTPRSSRRTPLPTISRLGSPSISAQYSPKKTPPRFKRDTPPLVLLHVTLLPLRWAWGEVLNNARMDELSRDGKTVRDAWNQLQDRMGDTTIERGILLPHPQNDYEVLEERLLEALELPMRRRARILECGHYLGPSNEFTLAEELDSDEEDDDYEDEERSGRQSMNKPVHWCNTCRSDIRFDSLGPGKIFRVKVFASNGLMKGGAWEACWKEMERVDVQLEPIVDLAVQEELERLSTEQEQAGGLHQGTGEAEDEYDDEPTELHHQESPDTPAAAKTASREEQGAKKGPASEQRSRDAPQPSAEKREPQGKHQEVLKNASLPQLVMRSARVLLQDKKNIIIGLLTVLIVMLAIRGGQPLHDPRTFQTIVPSQDAATAMATQDTAFETTEKVEALSEEALDLSDAEATSPAIEVELFVSMDDSAEDVKSEQGEVANEHGDESEIETESQMEVSFESSASENLDSDANLETEGESEPLADEEQGDLHVDSGSQEHIDELELDAEADVDIDLDAPTSVAELDPKVTETIKVVETVTEVVTATQWVHGESTEVAEEDEVVEDKDEVLKDEVLEDEVQDEENQEVEEDEESQETEEVDENQVLEEGEKSQEGEEVDENQVLGEGEKNQEAEEGEESQHVEEDEESQHAEEDEESQGVEEGEESQEVEEGEKSHDVEEDEELEREL